MASCFALAGLSLVLAVSVLA